ncbi:hypothetical protein [Mesorhizobium xinjiangense]|uniref:hypothetical protein n=1 Tax=Mesorhizobium xinjiangense TaxID=2678685 RepID=UPI0012EDD9FA|nr:hypothetical protein [Mesorhizobium xinjiangense]
MLGMLNLHALALHDGDGLRPELKKLFEDRTRPTLHGPNVVAFDADTATRLSGPPAPKQAPDELPDGVVRFPGRAGRSYT